MLYLKKISKELAFETSFIQKIMNQSLISLNHSHEQAKNQGYSWRVLDILASNSILITEESNLLVKKFGKNIRRQFYSSVSDVRKVCNYFLNNKNANIDIIAEQNEIIDKFFRWEDRMKKIEAIFGLKIEKNKENSIISFRSKKNTLKPSLMIYLILKLFKIISLIFKFLKVKQGNKTNKLKIFIFLFFKKRSFIMYKFLIRIRYFSLLKK